MRPDRPLIASLLALSGGVGLILGYCNGTTSFNAAYPFSGSILHIDITTSGPGVLGGLALIALGLLLMAWALIAAVVSQIVLIASGHDRDYDRDGEPQRLLED
jgi:uncharacterized membrane protein